MKIVMNKETWLLHWCTKFQLDISQAVYELYWFEKLKIHIHTHTRARAGQKSHFSTFYTILSTLAVILNFFSKNLPQWARKIIKNIYAKWFFFLIISWSLQIHFSNFFKSMKLPQNFFYEETKFDQRSLREESSGEEVDGKFNWITWVKMESLHLHSSGKCKKAICTFNLQCYCINSRYSCYHCEAY